MTDLITLYHLIFECYLIIMKCIKCEIHILIFIK